MQVVRINAARPTPAHADDLGHNLPTQLTSFVGRDREITDVVRLLTQARMLTLLGAPGVGKTRLAFQVGRELIGSYPDGVWWIDLAALIEPTLVPHSVATVLSVREQPGRPVLQTLAGVLRSRRQLLVLDNCEHLADACAELADTLLRACPGLTILATSRELLNVTGEIAWRVFSLSFPTPDDVPAVEDLLGFESVQLFVDRARLAVPAFALSNENAGAIAQICWRLDGIPLAIELAAARTHGLDVAQLATRLDDRFRLLTGGSRTSLPRHRTLRALVDWSYERLSEREQIVFRRLAVFAGGWSIDAAESVCAGRGVDPDELAALLLQLVDKSLVVAEEHEAQTRYRLLETIHRYALAQLQATTEVDEIRRRHADYCAALAEGVHGNLHGHKQVEWLTLLEVEHGNMRAALRWVSERVDTTLGLRLGAALSEFWRVRGYLSEGRDHLIQLLALTQTPASETHRATALAGLGLLHMDQGCYGLARARLDECLSIHRQLRDDRAMAETLNSLGWVATAEGDYSTARAHQQASLDVGRRLGDQRSIAHALNGVGWIATSEGDHAEARVALEEGVEAFRDLGDKRGLADSLAHLAWVVQAQGDSPRACALAAECLSLAWDLRDRSIMADALDVCVKSALAEGVTQRAAQLLAASHALRESVGSQMPPNDRADFEQDLALIRSSLGDRAFAAAWADGRAMMASQAIAYAVAPQQSEPPACGSDVAMDPGPPGVGSLLTTREREVAALVARGFTNRRIADELVIAKRTVDAHIYRILRRLGFETRAQIAAWAVEQRVFTPASN